MNQPPLNPDALENAADVIWMNTRNESGVCDADRRTDDYATIEAITSVAIKEYLAVAQPEVNSDTELHVGTLIQDKTGQQLWNVWRTGGPAVHWVDDEGRPATPVFPARVLYRPTEEPRDGR